MGKKGKWFNAVKKAFRSPSKETDKSAPPRESENTELVNGDHVSSLPTFLLPPSPSPVFPAFCQSLPLSPSLSSSFSRRSSISVSVARFYR